MKWLRRAARRRHPLPAAARPESEIDRHTAHLEDRLHADDEGEALPPDSHWCPSCRRGAGGPWCGVCGTPAWARELGAWNANPFVRRRSAS